MLQKYGVSTKIKTVVSNEQEFEAMREEIVKKNSLARCNKCGKLLAKVDDNGNVSVKRKDIDIVAKITNAKIKCPVCETVNEILL